MIRIRSARSANTTTSKHFAFAVEAPGVLTYAIFLDNAFRADFVAAPMWAWLLEWGALLRPVRPRGVAAAPAETPLWDEILKKALAKNRDDRSVKDFGHPVKDTPVR